MSLSYFKFHRAVGETPPFGVKFTCSKSLPYMIILPRSGGKMAILWYFWKIESVQKVIDYTLKMKMPTDRRHMHLTFYRSKYFKMPSFLSYNSSKDLVPNQALRKHVRAICSNF